MLASAGLSGDTLDLLNQVGWFLPFLALFVPVGLIFALATPTALYLVLGLVQLAAITCGLRTLMAHLRHSGFSSYHLKLAIIPFYLVICFITNIAAILAIGLVQKFF
jgi:hypothetical protein